jgi:hypothetical protein
VRRVTYSMGISLDGYIAGPDGDFRLGGARRGGLSLRHRRDTAGRRPPAGSRAVGDDAVLGRPPARIHRSATQDPASAHETTGFT